MTVFFIYFYFSYRSVKQFENLLYDSICPSIKALLRNLQEDYLASIMRSGINTAAALTTRVIRVARVLLIDYANLSERMLGEVNLLVTLMLHSMQPYMGDSESGTSYGGSDGNANIGE